MTEEAWDEGVKLLKANLRDQTKTEEERAIRGATIRAAMNHLSDDEWGWIVQQAITKPDGWYPTVGELLDLEKAIPPRLVGNDRLALPADTRSLEERRQAGRENARRALVGIERELREKYGFDTSRIPGLKSIPGEGAK